LFVQNQAYYALLSFILASNKGKGDAMLKEKMLTAFNKQINAEMYSAYLYLSMEAYFQSINLKGFANWMRAQAQEEMMHAMKIYDFVFERGEKVTLEAIDKPESSWDSPLAAFKEVLKHEQHVTSLINDLVDLAIKEKDHASNIFLQWFITEQVEEEASADEVIQRLKLVKENNAGLFMIDAQLGTRVFTMPSADPAA
jgi:ferritin